MAIRRKPTRWFHILSWNTETDLIEHGSWLEGTIYCERCDVSFDGRWMIYLAMGSNMETWTGLCHPPRLKSVFNAPNCGTRFGGGFWERENLLRENGGPYSPWPEVRKAAEAILPFRIEAHESAAPDWDFGGMLLARLRRDGWRRGHNTTEAGEDAPVAIGDTWQCRPSGGHPFLTMEFVGHEARRPWPFRFRLDGHRGLIPETADWVCWDAWGQLVFADRGVLYRYTPEALAAGNPSGVVDLEGLAPPGRPETCAERGVP